MLFSHYRYFQNRRLGWRWEDTSYLHLLKELEEKISLDVVVILTAGATGHPKSGVLSVNDVLAIFGTLGAALMDAWQALLRLRSI